MSHLAPIDLGVIGIYFTVVMIIGFFHARGDRTSRDYFLAGGDIGWIAIGASLFATNISSEHFIGLAGTGAASGLAVGHFEWLACIIVLLLGWVFVPFYLRSGVFTMPEFLERRFSRASRTYLASVSIMAYIFTKISVSLYAGALLLNLVAGWNMWMSALVLVIATGIYTIAGGLKAVIYTDLAQAVILIGGAFVLMAIGLDRAGGWAGLRAALPPDYFHMFKPASHPNFPWTGIVFGAPILGIWYWCTDQVIVQRVLAARNDETATSATIFAGYLKILPVFMLVLPGLIARKLYPEIEGDLAYPTLITRLLPPGLMGLVIAALLAALMSSLSSIFNSSSTLVTMDFYKPARPNASEKELVFAGRIATVVLVILGLAWIPFMKYISAHLYVYMQSVQAYISSPIAAVFLIGLFWPRANATGAISSLLGGFSLGSARFVLEVMHGAGALSQPLLVRFVQINFLHFSILMFFICSTILVTASLITSPPRPEQLKGFTWISRPPNEGAANSRLYLMNVFFSGALIAVLFGLWFWFR